MRANSLNQLMIDVLEHIVRQHAGTIGDGFIVMQDNARAHIAQGCMTFINDTDISVMNWPARSPAFNTTEHAWGILFRRIRQRLHQPENCKEPYRCSGPRIADHITKGHQ